MRRDLCTGSKFITKSALWLEHDVSLGFNLSWLIYVQTFMLIYVQTASLLRKVLHGLSMI